MTTPSKVGDRSYMNRAQRRALVYGDRVGRLLIKIRSVQQSITKRYPPTPRFRNPKVLSGYLSKLLAIN